MSAPTKPIVNATNLNGNIFAVLGAANSALRYAGQSDKTKELTEKVTSSKSYEAALAIISEYVEFEFRSSEDDDDDEFDDDDEDDE